MIVGSFAYGFIHWFLVRRWCACAAWLGALEKKDLEGAISASHTYTIIMHQQIRMVIADSC